MLKRPLAVLSLRAFLGYPFGNLYCRVGLCFHKLHGAVSVLDLERNLPIRRIPGASVCITTPSTLASGVHQFQKIREGFKRRERSEQQFPHFFGVSFQQFFFAAHNERKSIMADSSLDSLYLRRRGVFFVGRRAGTEQGLSRALKQGGERCRIGRRSEQEKAFLT